MTRISNKDKYSQDTQVSGEDYLIGTDHLTGKTKTYTIASIVALATDGGGVDTFATLNGNTLTLADGQTYDLTHIVDTDTDTFAIINSGIITFPNGDTVDLGSIDTDTDTFATINGNIITFADGSTRDITPIVDTDTDTFATLSGNIITFADGSTLDTTNTIDTDTFATLSGRVITFADGSTIDIPNDLPNTIINAGNNITITGLGTVDSPYIISSTGGNSIISKTGTNIVFTEDALYNEQNYLTSGDLTLDLTGAVVGTVIVSYHNGYIPTILGDYLITSGSFDGNSLNIVTMFYDGVYTLINIGNAPTLQAPNLSLSAGNTQITASWTASSGATNYIVEYDTDILFTSPTQVYSGNLLTVDITGLVNGATYYVRVKAGAIGQVSSGYSVSNATPTIGNILFQDDTSIFDASLWALNNSSGAWDGAVSNAYQWTEPLAGTASQSFIGGNSLQEVVTGSNITVVKFTLDHHQITTYGSFTVQMYGKTPTQNETAVFRVDDSTNTMWYKDSTGWVDSGLVPTGSWKMVFNGDNTVNFFNWSGSAWIQLTGTRNITDGVFYPIVRLDEAPSGGYNQGEVIRFSSWFISDYNYTTLNP